MFNLVEPSRQAMESERDFQKTMEYKPNPLVGTRLGEYDISGVVAEGGMGTVFRANQSTVGREVAIKFLPAEFSDDETSVKRMEIEARVLGSLMHNNIVKTFDFGFTDRGQPYIVMELLEGRNLKEILIEEGRLEPYRATRMFIQIADAMRCAHAQGVIHRDLKPHNVMVIGKGARETVKLLDFGIAKLVESSQKLTRVGEVCGSPFYMSPEQCTAGDVDFRTDIYSLGVIMYHAFTGVLPIKGDSFPETVRKKVTQDPLPFAKVAPELKNFLPELERTVFKCLKRSAHERHSSMTDLKDDLEWCLGKLSPDEKSLLEEPKPAIIQTKQRPIPPLPGGSEFNNEKASMTAQVVALSLASVVALVSLGAYIATRVLHKPQAVKRDINTAALQVPPTAPTATTTSTAAATTAPTPTNSTAATTGPTPMNSTAATTGPTPMNSTAATTGPTPMNSTAATTALTPTNSAAGTTVPATTGTTSTTAPAITAGSGLPVASATAPPRGKKAETTKPISQSKKPQSVKSKKTQAAQPQRHKSSSKVRESEQSLDELLLRKHSFEKDPNHFYRKF